ncbi:DoxX family protein [Ralstonia insidiosa]|uniref:DoxX family protein n=1 Tax=Ralstonia insidiosa TaxID=190721 RepID=A0A848NPP5_9RALS|nr:DoxX family protein [Ralstonia insidiosa]NMV37102.1 DoxX family protein [Ralstonia insidiosa]
MHPTPSTSARGGLLYRAALVLLCAAYLQGGLVKLFDFPGAIAEMQHFGMAPAMPMAAAVIVLELVGSALVISGRLRWIAALALAAFTLVASLLANRFWQAPADIRPMMANAFFEHLGLVGGFLLVALQDWISRREADVHTWTGQ